MALKFASGSERFRKLYRVSMSSGWMRSVGMRFLCTSSRLVMGLQ